MELETGKEIANLVKKSPQILETIYGDLAQPSVKKVGLALETVFEFSTSILLPVKLLNEKFKLNFERNLSDYKKKLDQIPEDKICDVNPQIGTPILEKLTYTTNEEIADLFTSLLTKASNFDTVNQAHPSFVQLIERLSVDEARIINHLLGKDFIPYVSFRAYYTDRRGYNPIIERATLVQIQVHLEFPDNIGAYLDNLCSIGILVDEDGTYKTNDDIYKPILEFYNYESMNTKYIEKGYKEVETDKSYFQISNFGKLFINAVAKK